MLTPPFKRSPLPLAVVHHGAGGAAAQDCCGDPAREDVEPVAPVTPASGRTRLAQLNPHLHCSVIGTCLSTAELRKLMGPYMAVKGATDLEVHHEAVGLAARGGEAARALHKALDHRHAATLRTFAAVRDEQALATAWDEASRQGEIPGAYWAVLTHRLVSGDLRQRAFGEVHMLSHLVGSANRADIRRLVALERDRAELSERLDREQQRRQELVTERDDLAARLQRQALDFERQLAALKAASSLAAPETQEQALVTVHTERRERAEQAAATAWAEAARLQQELQHLQRHAQALSTELSAAETELRQMSAASPGEPPAGARLLGERLRQRRVLYVGGRPSSTPAIRDLVLRHGGEFFHHDGGLETRKGLLAAAVPKADLVVFPVDCIDHDSALNLKRLSERHGVPFAALRHASVASFAAALSAEVAGPADGADSAPPHFCLRTN